jgi:hypothetical protein
VSVVADEPRDPDVQPVGEEIHLPGNTILPLVMAFGITLSLIGITTFIGFTIAGGLIFLYTLVRWIRDTRRDIEELPPDAH